MSRAPSRFTKAAEFPSRASLPALMLLGLDIGVSVVKASLFSEDGASVVASLPQPLQSSRPDWMEKDAELLWQACCTVVREVLDKVDPAEVEALGICACGNGCVLLDAQGEVLRPVIFSNDTRAASIARDAANSPSRARVFAKPARPCIRVKPPSCCSGFVTMNPRSIRASTASCW